MKAMDILAGDHRQRFLVSDHSVLTRVLYRLEPRFVLVPLRFVSEAWPRAGLGEPRSASNANKPASSWPLKKGRKKCSKQGCDRGTSTVASGLGTHKEKKVCVDIHVIHVQAAGSQICLQNICGQQRNSPMADPIFGSKYGPQKGFQNWITFSFLLLGLCLGPVLGSRFGPKSGASHRKIFAVARRCFASRFATH